MSSRSKDSSGSRRSRNDEPYLGCSYLHCPGLFVVIFLFMSATSKWKCPKCSNMIELFVALTQAPVCSNRKSHTGRPQKMELIAGQAAAAIKCNENKTRTTSKK